MHFPRALQIHKNQIRIVSFSDKTSVTNIKNDRWIVVTKATLPGGEVAASTSILKPLDEHSFTWQKVNRFVDGEILPNLDEVVIVRN